MKSNIIVCIPGITGVRKLCFTDIHICTYISIWLWRYTSLIGSVVHAVICPYMSWHANNYIKISRTA